MDARVREIRMQKWEALVTACNSSGMLKKDWFAIHHVNPKTFYRYQKALRERALDVAGVTAQCSDLPSTQFVDLTDAFRGTEHQPVQDQTNECWQTASQIVPELVIQAGQYNLYVGSGISEGTLSTVLKVIRNV